MKRPKPPVLDPATFYAAFGGAEGVPPSATDEGVVVPLESCTFATFQGPMRLTRGVPLFVGDATLRNEMRRCGVIA